MKVSVVLATHARRALLQRNVPAMLSQTLDASQYEVVIVVDGDVDGTVEMLKALRPSCTLRVIEQHNQGQAVAQNRGIREATGDIVLLLDDDIECPADLFAKHVAAHALNPDIVAFGPILVSPDSPSCLVVDWVAQSTAEESERLLREGGPTRPDRFLTQANCSAARTALLACGGLDERFVGGRDNLDLGLRLANAGLRFRYLPDAAVRQVYVKSADRLVCKDARSYGRNEVLLCAKHPAYRPFSPLNQLGEGSLSKRMVRAAILRSPVSVEPLLRLMYRMVERVRRFPRARRIGIRLLQLRQGVVMYRSALQQIGSWAELQRRFGRRVPVLLYHHVGPNRPLTYRNLTISPAVFQQHLSTMKDWEYQGVSPSDWLAWVREGKALPEKPVVITIDDGYRDLAEHAFPALQRSGYRAGVAIVTGQIGGTNVWDQAEGSGPHRLLTGEAIRYWSEMGIDFGCHTRNHPRLTRLEPSELAGELDGSAEDLSGVCGERPRWVAYPFGDCNDEVATAARRSFAMAFLMAEGMNTLATDPMRLRRTMIWPSDTVWDLWFRLHWGHSPLHRIRMRLRYLRDRLLGRSFEPERFPGESSNEPDVAAAPANQSRETIAHHD